MKYEDLPLICQMMLEYREEEYDEEEHAPSMEDLPKWLTDEELDNNMSTTYDMDGKVTRSFVLCRSLGLKLGLFPVGTTKQDQCEALEQELFYLMNRMTWMINKVCYVPNEDIETFDEIYARTRFGRRCNLKLPNVNSLIHDEFALGKKPVYADFIAYACIHDMRAFVPRCFKGINNKPVNQLAKNMEQLPQLAGWFEQQDASEAYIRPPIPSIHLSGHDRLLSDLTMRPVATVYHVHDELQM